MIMYLKLRIFLGLTINFIIDYFFYIKESGIFNENRKEKLLAKITYNYHSIEKGLSMPSLKLGFGKKKIEKLKKFIKTYLDKDYDVLSSQFIAGCSVLAKYFEIHKKNTFEVEDFFNFEEYRLMKSYSKDTIGGTIKIFKTEYFSKVTNSFNEFVTSRHSIRYFSEELIEIEKIKDAVELANFCPSACNRQSCKVYSVGDKSKVELILNIQKGVDSTAKLIHQLLIITSNRNNFFTSGERNQLYVDGGIFLESLLLSLHYKKIAACPLHWSLNYSHDKKIKNLIGLSSGEKVIALIAIGSLKDDLKVPSSCRKQIDEFFVEV